MNTKRIFSGLLALLLCLAMIIGMISMIASAETVTAAAGCCDETKHNHNDGTWTALEEGTVVDNNTFGGEAKIYLTGDVYIKSRITVYGSGSPHICLNGHKIIVSRESTDENYAILLRGKMTLCDCAGGGEITVENPTNSTKYQGLIQILDQDGTGAQLDIYGGTLTGNKTTSNGGGLRIGHSDAVVNMYGGVISGNTSLQYGGGVYVSNGTFNMYGGIISGNTVTYSTSYGGGVCVSNGTFNMYGGVISDNTVPSCGGGVYVAGGATFKMDAGNILTNNAGNGAGVFVEAGAAFTMNGGSIASNTTTGKGGGVFIGNQATVTMNAGSITANTADNGGGVWIQTDGTFTMNGGEITQNSATQAGSVYISGATFKMNGGRMNGNTSTSVLGVRVEGATAKFEMTSGVIQENGSPEKPSVRAISSGSVIVSGSSVIDYVDAYNTGATISIKKLAAGANIYASYNTDAATALNIVNDGTISTNGNVYTYNNPGVLVRMDLGNALDMQFAFKKTLGDSVDSVSIKQGSNTQTVDKANWVEQTINEEEYYVVTYTGVAAKKMADPITLTVGETVHTDSVKAYAERLLADSNTAEDALLVAMLNYGAASQTYFGYNTGNLANATLTEAQKALATEVALPESEAVEGFVSRLALENNIRLQIKVTGLTGDMTATYTVTDYTGHVHKDVQATIEQDGDEWYLVVDELVVADAEQVVTVTVMNGETQVAVVSDSIAKYVGRMAESDDMYELCKAIMAFSDAAKAYLTLSD